MKIRKNIDNDLAILEGQQIAVAEVKSRDDNYNFYACPKGHEILNSKNYSRDIISYLDGEQTAIRDTLHHHKNEYDALLEIGCGPARNIHLSKQLGLKYFGIDFIEKEVTDAKNKIKDENSIGVIKCLSVLDINHDTTPVPSNMRTLCLFPFNVFGNLFDPIRVMQTINKLNYSMIISTYSKNLDKNSILEYYTACGLNNIRAVEIECGTMFISREGFKSIIYNSEYIYQITHQLGMSIESREFSKLGKLYYIR